MKFGNAACRCRMAGCKGCGRVVVCSAGMLWLWYVVGLCRSHSELLLMVSGCELLVSFKR